MLLLQEVLAKLSKKDKIVILQQLIILPTIENDYSLSEEEFGNILTAGTKMGFAREKILMEIHEQVKAKSATIEPNARKKYLMPFETEFREVLE